MSQVSEGEASPRVWVLLSDAVGRDSQSIALAEALGWPYQTRRLTFVGSKKGINKYRGRFFGTTLSGIDASRSDPLLPPWPDLIIATGVRQVPVEFWIKAQNGGRTRLVHIQRPFAPVGRFDLVICDAYPPGKNVFSPKFPITRKDKPSAPEYLASWTKRFTHLPRPWVSLLIGGPARPFTMPPDLGERMMREVSDDVRATGGTLLISTSRRTPEDLNQALDRFRPPHSFIFKWQTPPAENPYAAMLHLSDRIIVTSDSIAMITEAVRAGKPTEIYKLPEGKKATSPRSKLASFLYRSASDDDNSKLRRFGERLRMFGFIDAPDHLNVFARRLVARGSASYFGESAGRPPTPLPDEMAAIVKTIKQWY